MKRLLRIAGWGLLALVVLALSGLLLADHLTPEANGAPSTALPVQADATELDRELAPLLAAHPGQTGALMVNDGIDAFAARALAARKAGRSLDLQYYIWHDDLAGRLLALEAWNAAERGVRVRVLLDDMNAAGMDSQLLLLDGHPNVELRLYNPFRNRSGLLRGLELVQRVFSVNHRMHNKAWIADGRVAVLGGRNIGDEYFGAADEVNFRDLDMVLFGPAVDQASAIFDAYWNSAAAVPLASLAQAPEGGFDRVAADTAARGLTDTHAQRYLQRVAASPRLQDYMHGRLTPYWSTGIQVVSDPPLKWKQDQQDDWLVTRIVADIATTGHKALLISPYFVPGDAGSHAMTELVAQGRTVGVVTNSLAANDVPAVYGAYVEDRDRLLHGGVHVYELRARHGAVADAGLFGSSGASLHTKAYSVDDRRGFVGSFNLDPRSAYLNTEMGVMFDDPALARAVREEYLRLAAPTLSYWMYLDDSGNPRWLDRTAAPPTSQGHAPDTGAMQRFGARFTSWLPLESQL